MVLTAGIGELEVRAESPAGMFTLTEDIVFEMLALTKVSVKSHGKQARTTWFSYHKKQYLLFSPLAISTERVVRLQIFFVRGGSMLHATQRRSKHTLKVPPFLSI